MGARAERPHWADWPTISATQHVKRREARARNQASAKLGQCPPGKHSMLTLYGAPDSPKDVCWDCDYEVVWGA